MGFLPKSSWKRFSVYLQALVLPVRVADAYFGVDVAGGLRQIRVLEHGVSHLQVYPVAGHRSGIGNAFQEAVERDLAAGLQVFEIFGKHAGHHRKQVFEICLFGLESEVKVYVFGRSGRQGNIPVKAQAEIIEL